MPAPWGGDPRGPSGHLRGNSPLCLVPKINTLWAVTWSSRKGRLPPVSSRKPVPKCRRLCRDLASSKDWAGPSVPLGGRTSPLYALPYKQFP